MFDIWTSGSGGLGQERTCEQVVQDQLARGYVFAATALAWSGKGNVKAPFLDFWAGVDKQKLEQAISADLAANQFYGIRIDAETPLVTTGPGTKIGIWVTAPVDFSSLNHVQNLITGIVGNHVNNVQDVTVSVRQIPPMCTGSPTRPSPGTQAPMTPAPGTPRPDAGKCAGKTGLESIACELGLTATSDILQWLVIGVVGIIAVKSLIK